MNGEASVHSPMDRLESFFGHAIALEEEAAERLQELAGALQLHNNQPLAGLLSELAEHSQQHAQEVAEMGRDLALPKLHAWDYQWPQEESPEAVAYGAIHYLMSPREALLAALQVEQQAQQFYRDIASQSSDPEIVRYAGQFADEEQEHVALVQARLDALQDADMSRGAQKLDLDPPHMPE